ncbi:MAG: polysaccharide biosynthesis tyrosine autokinase [Anaerolineae bacterium]|nr:polysaccharide biosynthesis tyrosine autokinase [Anaerolineae bacterium]
MEIKEYLATLRKWWWLLLVCVLVSSGFSYAGTLQMPRIYQATTTIMIGQALQKSNPSNADLYISQQLAQTYADMVKRRPVLAGAAEALGLNFVPASESITTRQVPGTQLLEISVQDTNALRAQALADEIAHQLIIQSPAGGDTQKRQDFIEEQLSDLESKIQLTDERIEEEEAKLDASNSARAIQQYQTNISALEQKRATYQSTYASLLQSTSGGTNYITIIEPAKTPTTPISPNVAETVLLSAAIGLGLAVGGAVLVEFLDDSIKSPEEAEKLNEVPLLGAIAKIEGDEYPDKLITAIHPLSPITEAYRVLRTNIQFASVDKPVRSLMLTSPGPIEGKSTNLANLGVVFAQTGRKVVIADTDLRRPVQHKIFGLSNAQGFCDLVLDPDLGIMECLQPTSIENLSLLASGSCPPNPTELLASARAGEVIESLHQNVDMVLFDSPPTLVVADAAVLGSRVDCVLLVNDLGNTRRTMSRRASEELKNARVNLLGFILNRMTARHGSYYYQYYYYRDGERVKKRHSRKKGLLNRLVRLFRNGRTSGNKSEVVENQG